MKTKRMSKIGKAMAVIGVMNYIRLFFISMVAYSLISWVWDFSLLETHHWFHYILGGILFGVVMVTIFYFRNRSKKN
jgi:exosortase/archaeosortase family protein